MSGFLLDTNVLFEFSRRGGPDPAVKRWMTAADDVSLFTSALILAEIAATALKHDLTGDTQRERLCRIRRSACQSQGYTSRTVYYNIEDVML